MAVSQQEMVEAFKNDATPVQASIFALKRYTKENEVTINWNSSKKEQY
jgi:hypothetical protein